MRLRLYGNQGYHLAVLGTMLSYGKTSFDNFSATMEDINELANKLAHLDGGHNKFLEQIHYQILIEAPLYWWKQFDTYRVGVSKSSESTMHKSWKNGLTQEDFEQPVFPETLDNLNALIREYTGGLADTERKQAIERQIINNLPDGYLQTRFVDINAKALRNIYFQRKNHKLPEWHQFCEFIGDMWYGHLITKEN